MKASFPFGDIVLKSTRTSGTWEETRQQGAGKKGELSFFSHPPPPHPCGSLALRLFTPSSKVQCLFPILVNRGGLKPSATAPGKFDRWHHIRTLWGRLGTAALGSTIDKRPVWLRISEKGDALAELFVCLFVCLFSKFPLPVVTVFRWVRVMTKRGHGGEKLFKRSDYLIFFHQRIISGTRI